MEIYRYPKSNPSLGTTTDEGSIEQKFDKNSIDMDITVAKGSFKESRVKIQFDLPDLKYLHKQYVNQLEQIIQAEKIKNESEISKLKNATKLLVYIILNSPFNQEGETMDHLKQLLEWGCIGELVRIKYSEAISPDLLAQEIRSVFYTL